MEICPSRLTQRPLGWVAMNEPVSTIRPETRALDVLIQETVARAEASSGSGPADTMLFLGNRHQSFPTAVIKDPVLEPVDKLVWMVIMLQVRETGGDTAFPGYEAIGRMANIGSRSTIARAIAILRASRWLTLCARIRKASGRFLGNLYALHDEPLPLADALHLDTEYMAFLSKALGHGHARVRAVAQGILASIDEEIEAGREVCDQEHPIERRLASAMATEADGSRRFFAFSEKVVQRLRCDLTAGQEGVDHHDQNSNLDKNRVRNLDAQKSNSGCSSSDINKTTTTYTGEMPKFEPGREADQPLIYPRRLSDNQREVANRHLLTLSPKQRQLILDELEGRFRAEQKGMKPLYDEISFLHSLCKAVRTGEFQPNLGIKVYEERLQRNTARRHAAAEDATPPAEESDEQRQARMANGQARITEMRKTLGMRTVTENQSVSAES